MGTELLHVCSPFEPGIDHRVLHLDIGGIIEHIALQEETERHDMTLVARDLQGYNRQCKLMVHYCGSPPCHPRRAIFYTVLRTTNFNKFAISESLWLAAGTTSVAYFNLTFIRLDAAMLMISIYLEEEYDHYNLVHAS